MEQSLRTIASLDLGVKDQTVLWIAQIYGKEVRIVDCYANRNESIKHYSDYLYKFRDKYDARIEVIYLPHDSNIREMTSDVLQTRYEKMKELGQNVKLVAQVGRDDGIDKVRDLLDNCCIDDKRCKEGIRALRNYRRVFDEKLNRYKNEPLHDWASDYADSFRYLALGLEDVKGASNGIDFIKMQRQRMNRR